MKNKSGKQWFEKKEATHSTLPYILTFWCLKHFPRWFTNFIAWCASVFYFIFVRRTRTESKRYQKKLVSYYPEKKIKIRPFRQLIAFSVTILEKIDCWTNEIPFENIHFNDDDVYELIERLNRGEGAFVFISHLGNFEILRSLANAHKMGLKKEVPFAVVSDMDVSSNFSQVLKKISPGFVENTVNADAITPATIEKLMDTISSGGIVVCSGDRLSKNVSEKIITQDFLGQPAPFSYGAFLLALLLEAPVYFLFGLKKRDLFFSRKFEMYVRKAKSEISSSRKRRAELIQNLCTEYAHTLEEFCKEYPYQWYNFFDFWSFPEKKSGVENGTETD